MSSYIIAGSADSIDTAYCQQLARRIKSKYKNIDFRVVIKHPSEWEDYLNQICRIYGFLKKSNPIIYTYHGKIIGNKDAFVNSTVKYFGLNQEALIVKQLSTAVNVKLANQELQKKKALKNNIKTLPQKIKITHDKLLKQGVLRHEFKTKAQFLVNGIQYYFRSVPGICPAISFKKNFQIPVQVQNIAASNLDLMQLSLQDQITPDQHKQPFVTTTQNQNQVLNTESMQRMSEASRTNKLQSSVMSKDEDSKINKQSNKQKQKIDQEFDDVADFNNVNMEALVIGEFGDQFFLGFQNKTHVSGEMVLYHNQAHNGNFIRVYNDRPVIGHHTIVKEIHYIVDQETQEIQENMIKENEEEKESEDKQQEKKQQPEEHQQKQGAEHQSNPAEKSKTQPNIPPQKTIEKKPYPQQQALSEPCSDLNLVSNLNYHTLYILKPLSNLQLRYILQLLNQTNTVVTLQFLPENPNPKIKAFNRGLLLDSCDSLFPIQNFINKQIQDHQFVELTLPRDWQEHQQQYKITVKKINEIGFTHLYFQHHEKLMEEELAKNLKIMIDQVLFLQESLKKQIGYNLIITKKFTLLVALTEPYKVFGVNPMYFDGLAYLGFVQIAQVLEGYKLKQEKIQDGQSIRDALARCSGFQFTE